MRSDVVGPVCESGDYLALDRELPELAAKRPYRDHERGRLWRSPGRNVQFPALLVNLEVLVKAAADYAVVRPRRTWRGN